MFNQSFRKYAFLTLFGIGINFYIKAEQLNLGDLNLTAESQVIYYPTKSGIYKNYWSDLSVTIEDLNLTGDPSSFNEDTKYLIKKNFLKNQVPSAFEKLDPNHYTWSEDITEKRNEIIKAIYSKEWSDLWQEASVYAQTKVWEDLFVDTEKYDILHNSIFATSVFDITSDQNYSVKAYTTGWFFNPEIGWLFSTKDTFPYFYDPTTGQWMQFLQMEGRHGFLHAQTMLLIDVNSSSISPISPFWDSDYYDSNLTLQNLNNSETNPLVDIPNTIPHNYYLGIAGDDFSTKSTLFEWVDIFSGKFQNLKDRSTEYDYYEHQERESKAFQFQNLEDNSKWSSEEEDAPSDDELNESDEDRQAAGKGVGDDDNGSEALALEKAGILDLENPEDAARADTYVEVAGTTYDDGSRRSGQNEVAPDSFEQLKLDAVEFVKIFAVNDAFQNPHEYDWGDVFDISDDMETYILSIKDGILQSESDDYQVLTYDSFISNLVEGTRIGHLRAAISDDIYYNFIKAVLSQQFPTPDDARLNLVTQNENNKSRYEFYFHKDNLEVFKSLSDLTCDKPYTNGWYYTFKDGWLWTNEEVFPFIYRNSDGGWLYFYGRDEGSKFYDYNNKAFVPLSE